ncbi:MAG: hypothetical protein Tsb0020_03990 [Haliangiales bacterium]
MPDHDDAKDKGHSPSSSPLRDGPALNQRRAGNQFKRTSSGMLPPQKTAPPAVVMRKADGTVAEPLPFTGISDDLAAWAFHPHIPAASPQALVQARGDISRQDAAASPSASGPENGSGQFPLDFNADEKAEQLHNAMDGWGTDERAILDILWTGRRDMTRAIEQAYNRRYAPPLETALHDELSGSSLRRALQILGHGEMTLRDKLREAADGWGTDDVQIFNSLDRASPQELAALRADEDLLAHVRGDLSGADLELFNAYVAGHGVLAGKLRRAVDGWGTDEAAIWRGLEQASPEERQFVLARPSLMADILSDLDTALQLRFKRMLRGTLSNVDRIDIALAGWGTDEAGLEGALSGLSAAELARLPADIDQQLEGELSGQVLARCQEILHQKRLTFDAAYRDRYMAQQTERLGEGANDDAGRSALFASEGQSQSAVGRLKTACAGIGTDDKAIWSVLSGLSEAERRFIREHNPQDVLGALRGDLSDADYERAMVILGGGSAAAIASLRRAVDGWGTDERLIYDGIDRIVRQGTAGDVLADTEIMQRLQADISAAQYQVLRQALHRGEFTPIARLRWATAMAGTDEELVWELCRDYGSRWYESGVIDPLVDAILQGELDTRDYWRALDLIRGEPKTEQERRDRAKELLERERGGVSSAIMDSLSSSGENADDAWREYQATYNRAVADGEVTPDEQQRLRRDEEYSRHMTAEYREAKSSVAQWATTIAVAIVGIAATLVTAGAAGPFVAGLAASMGGNVSVAAQAMVMAAALKVGLNRAIQGEGYDVTSTTALVDAVSASVEVGLNMLGGQVAIKFVQGLSRTSIASSVGPSVQRVFGRAGQRILAQGLESSIDGAIGGIGEGVILAIGNESTWQGEIEDVLGNIGQTVAMSTLMSAGGAAIAGTGLRSIGEVIGPRLRGNVPDEVSGASADSLELGGRGPATSWDGFDEALAGGPIRELSTEGVRITERGIEVVEGHVARFGEDPWNQGMLERLRRIAAGEIEATPQDLNFYTHELREFVRYRRQGWKSGVPEDPDEARRLWLNTHTATLDDYGFPLRQEAELLYHPSVRED